MANLHQFDRAEELCKSITQPDILNWALSGIGQAYAKSGNITKAREILGTLQRKNTPSALHEFASIASLALLGHGLFYKDNNRIRRLGDSSPENLRVQDDFLIDVIEICLEKYNWKESKNIILLLLNERLKEAYLLKWFKLLVDKSSIFIAQKSLKYVPNKLQEEASLFIIQKLIRNHLIRRALLLSRQLVSPRIKDEINRDLALFQAEHNRFRQARFYIGKIEFNDIRSKAFFEYTIASANAGKLTQAWRNISHISKKEDQEAAYAILFPLLYEKEPTKAQLAFARCKNTRTEAQTVSWLCVHFAELGQYDEIFSVTEKFAKPKQQNIWVGITSILMKRGNKN